MKDLDPMELFQKLKEFQEMKEKGKPQSMILKELFDVNEQEIQEEMTKVMNQIFEEYYKNNKLAEESFSIMSMKTLNTCVDCGKQSEICSFYIYFDKDEDFQVACAGRCRECFRKGDSRYENIGKIYHQYPRDIIEALYTEKELKDFETHE